MPTHPSFARASQGVAVLALASLTACASVGPNTVSRDRFDYMTTLSDSWKRQTLVNLVKLRYADAPVFLDVDSVISSYTWEGEVNLGGTSALTHPDSSLTVGASGRYSDQPTITYTPLSGAKFARALMTPFTVGTVFALMQNGYRADGVLRICVSSINGVENAYGGPGSPHPAGREFAALAMVLRNAQLEGRLDIRTTAIEGKSTLVMKFRPAATPAAASSDAWFVQTLGLDASAPEYTVVQGSFPTNNREIAITTRSMLQVLTDLASYIEVPERDVIEGRVYAPPRTAEQLRDYPPILRIRSSKDQPTEAFSAVEYRGHWFWLDDRDVQSKTTFNFIMLMFSLTETGDSTNHPILTVPTR